MKTRGKDMARPGVFRFTADELNLNPKDHRLQYHWAETKSGTVQVIDGFKCGGCNWECDSLYAEANSRDEAKHLIEAGEIGMCGECFAEYLAEKE